MPFYTSEQILNQALDSETGTLKTSNDQLGTPGTGEPAHAGGSTGVIGWLRDILAKIAAFGTSAAPSADVLSVQSPVRRVIHRDTPLAINTEFYSSAYAVRAGSTKLKVIVQSDQNSSPDGLAVLYFKSEADLGVPNAYDGNWWHYLPLVPLVAGAASPTGFWATGQAEIEVPLYAPYYMIYYKSGGTLATHLFIASIEY